MRSRDTKLDPSGTIMGGVAANVVAFGLAATAGVHAGLVPEHLREAPQLGALFVLATALPLAVAAWVAIRPADWRAFRSAQFLITGLVVAYLASCTVGIPVFQPEVEHVDVLGVSTKAIEILALLCAFRLGRTPGGRRSPLIQEVPR
ncbi:MAG TPA: hypothetical protein VFH90_08760 [Candidatus Limnocylindria bacterium]|nr:hypothetical protein [Candidatus Limnocylindria bacterium]